MQRPWAFWRRVQYGAGFFFVLLLIGSSLYYRYGYEAPNCFDTFKNGDEKGIDCGGVCTRICSFEIIQPTILWSESFKVTDGQYNAVSYVENRNANIGSPAIHYTLTLSDSSGIIATREGVTVLPPDSVYPIFEGRIVTGTRVPTKTEITFNDDIVWLPGESGREQFMLEKRELINADSKPRLVAQLRNTSLDEAQDVEIIATIFDVRGNPLTVARTVVDYFKGRTTENVTFTWPEPIAKTLRSCEIPTDVVLAIDLSGSMNNDGGTPPEPITSVLKSATSFVTQLNQNDQVAIVTYATKATLTEMLTHDSTRVAKVIPTLLINPKEEQGSTNTGDALLQIRDELSSSRHNLDARKVAILLTDGLATAPEKNPEEYAQNQASLLKDAGVHLFTIGLGTQVNQTFLKNIASNPTDSYTAPTTKELNTIYASITKAICEDGPAVIEIIPKAKTSFSPLK